MNAYLAVAVAAALASFALVALLRRTTWAARLADRPNARSLHEVPTPRVGGVAVVAVALPLAAWGADAALAAILGCAAALAAVSLLDDFRSLPVAVRLPAHAVAATVAVLAIAGSAQWGAAVAAIAVVAIMWMANLYNFMDGADGLAGGMGAIGFAALAVAAAHASHAPLAIAATALAGACAGFLAHNYPPARVFLGDCGAVPLGFLAGALGLHGALAGTWPIAFPLLVFSPFIADASVTLARRLARRERVWIAHRGHLYQRLALAGWPRRRLALAAHALMLAAAASALWAEPRGERMAWAILFVWAAGYALLFLVAERWLRSRAVAGPASPGSGIV